MTEITVTLRATLSEIWGADELLESSQGESVERRRELIRELINEDIGAFIEECDWTINWR